MISNILGIHAIYHEKPSDYFCTYFLPVYLLTIDIYNN